MPPFALVVQKYLPHRSVDRMIHLGSMPTSSWQIIPSAKIAFCRQTKSSDDLIRSAIPRRGHLPQGLAKRASLPGVSKYNASVPRPAD